MIRLLDRVRPGPVLLLWLVLHGTAAGQSLPIPDVPYVPQSSVLCGGASLAMVLRYWGATGIQPEDFSDSLNAEGTGIETAVLSARAESLGFQAIAFGGGEAEAMWHLRQGRPLISLLGDGSSRYHYVVVLAWANGLVMFHDPATGPFKALPEKDWRRRWDLTGQWALVVIPRTGAALGAGVPDKPPPSEGALPAGPSPGPAPDPLPQGQTAGGLLSLPDQASVEFRLENWARAADLAAQAVRLDPQNSFNRRLLATSLFLDGRLQDALDAWNRVGEPRLDLVRVEGLARSSTRIALEYLAERPGPLLTPERFRRVERRVEALPATQFSRVSYRPLKGGAAQIDVNVVERPAVSSLRSVLLSTMATGVTEQAIGVELSALAGSGELVELSGKARTGRSRGRIAIASPHFLSLPGVVTLEVLWDDQSYRLGDVRSREQRQRASFSLAHWLRADTRLTGTLAVEQWNARGRYLSMAGGVDQRLLRDHMAVTGDLAVWSGGQTAPFHAGSVRVAARTRLRPDRPRLSVLLSYDVASSRAPLSLWSGAGTGTGRSGLLRARPLLDAGVLSGVAFGRELWNGTAEGETPIGSLGPARLSAVAFVDAVNVVGPGRALSLVDVGAGVRVRPPGLKSALRLDLATPLGGRLRPRLSGGWERQW